MTDETHTDPDPTRLIAEAQALEENARHLHEVADTTPPGSPERLAADELDEEANEDWEAASAVTSKLEGFSGGEPA